MERGRILLNTMRRTLSILFFLICSSSLIAQSDSSAYNTQRNKINQLLDDRSARFNQYDNSLTKRSGIFGLKTKKDMQASNDILTQIVITDNNIFQELKILLDYKDFEKKEVEHRAVTVEGRIDRFQTTITRLQQENDRLKVEVQKQTAEINRHVIYLVLSLFGVFILIIYAISIKKLRKTDNRVV